MVKFSDYVPDEHYNTICGWWNHYYKGTVIPKDCLPDTGVVAILHENIVAAAFIYKTNSNIVWVHFPIVSNEIRAGKRFELLDLVVGEAVRKCKEMLGDRGVVWTCTDHAVAARAYSENGMVCSGEADVFYSTVGINDTTFLE